MRPLSLLFLLISSLSAQVGTNNTGVSPVGTGGGGGGSYSAGQGIDITGSTVSTTPGLNCIPSDGGTTGIVATPCTIRLGNRLLSFGSTMTFTPSAGTGVAFVGVSNAGVMTAWHDVTATCTNLTCVGSTSDIPDDAAPIAKFTVTAGAVTAVTDYRLVTPYYRITSSATNTVACDPTTGVCQLHSTSTPDVYYCADAGSTDAYACTPSPAPGAYVTGTVIYLFKANTVNTGAATLNVNSLGAKTIKKYTTTGGTDLADGDIRAGQIVAVVYDGTNMQMVSGLGNAGSAAAATTRTKIETYWMMTGNNTSPVPWSPFSFTGATQTIASSINWYGRPGLSNQISAATDNAFAGWRAANTGATAVSFTSMPSGGSTTFIWEFKSPSTGSFDLFLRADGASDLGSGPADSPANTVGFRRLSGANFFVQWCVASSCGTQDTSISLSTDTNYRLTLTIPQSGNWSWQIESGNDYSTSNTGTAAGSIPSTDLVPIIEVRNDGAVQPTFTMYYYKHYITLP